MKIAQDLCSLLRCLVMYHLLKDHQSEYLSALKWPEAAKEVVEVHLRTGCFVHLALIEGRGEVSNLLGSQCEFGQLRMTDQKRHEIARAQRSWAQTRWSNEKKRLNLNTLLERVYQLPAPDPRDLQSAFSAARARCELRLRQSGYNEESELLVKLATWS